MAGKPPEDTDDQVHLAPPEIGPDATKVVAHPRRPSIVTGQQRADPGRLPGAGAVRSGPGPGAIDCLVTGDGKLARCQVAAEEPPGYGFGQATLDLAADFVMKPRLVDGELDPRAVVRVGVKFSPADSAAPLSLDTQPPKP